MQTGPQALKLGLQLEFQYFLKKPYFMKKATMHVEAIFDNSSKNLNNPLSLSRTVFLGENTTDETAFFAINTYRNTPPDASKDFLNYMKKQVEAEALKKLLGAKSQP